LSEGIREIRFIDPRQRAAYLLKPNVIEIHRTSISSTRLLENKRAIVQHQVYVPAVFDTTGNSGKNNQYNGCGRSKQDGSFHKEYA